MRYYEEKKQNDGWQIIIGVSCGLLIGCVLIMFIYKGAFTCAKNQS